MYDSNLFSFIVARIPFKQCEPVFAGFENIITTRQREKKRFKSNSKTFHIRDKVLAQLERRDAENKTPSNTSKKLHKGETE